MEIKDQVYILGQIYARLSKVAGINDPLSFKRACEQPMKEITILYTKKIKGRLPKEDEDYVSVRFNDIDINNDLLFSGILPTELQGTFQLAYYQSFVEKSVKELIARSGYNQSEIAEMLGVNPNTVSRWVTGGIKISQENLYRIERLKKENK